MDMDLGHKKKNKGLSASVISETGMLLKWK